LRPISQRVLGLRSFSVFHSGYGTLHSSLMTNRFAVYAILCLQIHCIRRCFLVTVCISAMAEWPALASNVYTDLRMRMIRSHASVCVFATYIIVNFDCECFVCCVCFLIHFRASRFKPFVNARDDRFGSFYHFQSMTNRKHRIWTLRTTNREVNSVD